MRHGTIIYTQQEKLQAQRIGVHPDLIAPALMKMLLDTSRQALAKHPCAPYFAQQGVSLDEVEQWFTAFAKGVHYVHERYGTIFGHCALVGAVIRNGMADYRYLAYNSPTDTVAVTSGFVIEDVIKARDPAYRGGTIQTPGYHFTALEATTLLGVEEAYHAYQMKCQGPKYAGKHLTPPPPGASELERVTHYYHDPLERDARSVVMDAAKDLNLGHDAQERILQSRLI